MTTTIPATLAAGRLFLDAARRQHKAFGADPQAVRLAAESMRLALSGAALLVDGELPIPATPTDKDQARVARIEDGELSLDQIGWQLDRVERQLASLLAEATVEGWWPEQADPEHLSLISAEIDGAGRQEVDDQ